MKKIGIIIAVAVGMLGLLGLGIAGKILFFPVNTINKQIETAYGVQNKTLNADNAIYNYQWFKQQHQDINTTKAQLDNASMAVDLFKKEAGDRSKWTFEDKNEASRLESIRLGLKNNLEKTINDYNARASMANRAIFEDKLLPGFIESLTFINK
jgi:hypothetical protein